MNIRSLHVAALLASLVVSTLFGATASDAAVPDARPAAQASPVLPLAATKRQACLVSCANTKKQCDAEPHPNHDQCRKEWQACEKKCP